MNLRFDQNKNANKDDLDMKKRGKEKDKIDESKSDFNINKNIIK